MKIDSKIPIEDLIEICPASISYLMDKGIRCLVCGEPSWGTLESAAKEKGFTDSEINEFVVAINDLI